jgi:lactate dehydrogenase-like 2-hydroxyacid dehydrogenase
MAKPKVFATHGLFEPARKILEESCEVEYWTQADRPPRPELMQRVQDKEGLVCLLTEKVSEELLRAAPKLRIAANVAVGFDNIDVAACTKRGVVATNTPGVLDETTAAFAWTLMMAAARRLGEGEALARSGIWQVESGSTCGDRRLGKDTGDCGIRADWAGDGAAGERFSDESDLHGRSARAGGRGKGIEDGVSRHECAAGGI